MKILFLVPYPVKESPSQRFRFEQYFDILKTQGHFFEVHSFLQSKNWKLLFENGHVVAKAGIIFRGVMRRFRILFSLARFDVVFIHREAMPVGPPVLEWLIAKLFRKKIIFDYDDAIWTTDRQDETKLMKLIRWRKKVSSICRWSYAVSAGNEYLCRYARQFNSRVIYNPSTINTENTIPIRHRLEKTIIGWTGSHSTLKYLKPLEPVLQHLELKNPNIEILIIADKPPQLAFTTLRFLKWSSATEVEDLDLIDIGIMPLPDDEWSKGKCGFKALQYMSLGKPALVSPVGVNTTIVDHGVNGFHCFTDEDWLKYMQYLIDNAGVSKKMGANGRQKVVDNYSVSSNASNFLRLFE